MSGGTRHSSAVSPGGLCTLGDGQHSDIGNKLIMVMQKFNIIIVIVIVIQLINDNVVLLPAISEVFKALS